MSFLGIIIGRTFTSPQHQRMAQASFLSVASCNYVMHFAIKRLVQKMHQQRKTNDPESLKCQERRKAIYLTESITYEKKKLLCCVCNKAEEKRKMKNVLSQE
ncbi:CLUMA_CG003229, isoform A [Clunio marinus]|uniref:CLUMA_CG003229, isoform A n=1 Tax=Clunio marinus TaxID=568069 RepID=A0A1J1HN65_9DIPT|nr:CLUMA_CG003229, isoform A [Clunio marinus]